MRPPVPALLGGLLAWGLGHVPWASPEILGGALGRVATALLPQAPGAADALPLAGYASASVAGLLLAAWALAPRPGTAV
jgi:hypothetical protein